MDRYQGKRILSVLSQIYRDNKDKFEDAIKHIYQIDNQYISKKKTDKRKPIEIPDTPLWFENNLSIPQRVIIVFKVMEKLEYTNDEIVKTLRELTLNSMP